MVVQFNAGGGFFPNTMDWLKRMKDPSTFRAALNSGGEAGLDALRAHTPIDTGLASDSWGYRIVDVNGGVQLEWFNSNVENGIMVVLLIQYGHGTGTGGYVPPTDFINPAMEPVFDEILAKILSEVNR